MKLTMIVSVAGTGILAACTSTQQQHYSGFDQQAWNNAAFSNERTTVQEAQRQQAEMRYYSRQKLVNKNKAEARTAEEFVDTELALRKATVERGELKGYYRTGTPDAVNMQNINNSNTNVNESSSGAGAYSR
ncbi:MAG: hypothetical protein LBD30_02590 [Verrucomicrobiales bacterium]|jgi:hypothetical protein|nr:hypothetical protein [Verrucomicrobiales bacterium]